MVELVLYVAQQVPAPEVPPALRKFLRFKRVPNTAVPVTKQALTDPANEAFRTRVRDLVDNPDAIGEAGWLLLDQPEGWERAVDGLVDERAAEETESSNTVDLRRARKENDRLRRALDKAEANAADAQAEVARLREDLALARRDLAGAEQRAGELEQQLVDLERGRARAVRELKATEQRLAERTQALRDADDRRVAAEDRAEQLALQLESKPPAAQEVVAEDPAPEGPGVAEPAVDRSKLAALVGDAAGAAHALSQALAEASALLEPDANHVAPAEPEEPGEPAHSPVERRRRGDRRRRQPARLPVGMFDDSTEAVDYLARVPGMTMLIDGYNVSMKGWPGVSIELQRQRLLDAVASIAARTAAQAIVVFDGEDVGRVGKRARRPGVEVRFSPPGVEADDVVIELVDTIPPNHPVTVVSSDNRVRDGGRAAGANVVRAEQLLSLV